jgi:hypothetical protein
MYRDSNREAGDPRQVARTGDVPVDQQAVRQLLNAVQNARGWRSHCPQLQQRQQQPDHRRCLQPHHGAGGPEVTYPRHGLSKPHNLRPCSCPSRPSQCVRRAGYQRIKQAAQSSLVSALESCSSISDLFSFFSSRVFFKSRNAHTSALVYPIVYPSTAIQPILEDLRRSVHLFSPVY